MKKTVKIEGLDCPNCARTLEAEINKIEGVKNAEINFVKGKLSFESEDINALQKIVELSKKIEPNAKIIDSKKKINNKKILTLDLVTLGVGIALGLLALLLPLPVWAFWLMYVLSALSLGYKTYYKAIRLLFKGVINENLLITLSVVGATAIGEYMEGLMVVCLYTIGKILEGLAVNRSRKSIEALTNFQVEYANLITSDGEKQVSPSEVEVGSLILVKSGEKVPLDGVVVEGKSALNMQSLTGESVPVHVEKGCEVLSGAISLDGVLKIQTTKKYEESTVSKIMNLIENASEKKSKTETLISKITRYYTLGVILLALIVWGIVWAVTSDFNVAIYRGLIFLVVSCPCAFAISVPLSYFSGLGNASKKGILIKGSNFLDACAKLNLVAFDKTGTLTTGNFKVVDVKTFEDISKDEAIYLASLGEQYSLHPLAKSIVLENTKPLEKVKNVKEEAGVGVSYTYKKHNYFVGRRAKNTKGTTVELYKDDKLMAEIYLADTIKSTSSEACAELEKLSVKTVLLSGDNFEVANSVGKEIGIKEVKAELLPQDKYAYLENAKKDKKNFIGYVGDGLNDAPSLMLADVGISMGINGSPASIEASDVVLVDDNPKKVATAIKISKFTRKIVWENIILSALVKLTFLLLGALGITGMTWAVFADVGVTLLAIINSMRALRYTPKEEKIKKVKSK